MFDRYLASLAGSWEALVAPHAGALVVRGDGFLASRVDRHPVLNNVALLRPDALDAAVAIFDGTDHYAVWSADDATAAAIAAAGLVRDTTTVPMVRDLDDPLSEVDGVRVDVAPGVVADITGVDVDLLRGVPGLWTFASAGLESCLVLLPVDTDVNVGFVGTRESARRRGLAGRVLRHALHTARGRGFRTASLQSTPMAEGLYRQAGFAPVGHWREWVPAGSRSAA